MALPDEQVHQDVRVLARKVVPVANPLEFARQRFEVPTRGGVYVFSTRTKQLRPLDETAAAREDLPPELVEQARGYLQWCRNIHKQGDCLQVLRSGGVLDAHGRYAVAMAIAQGATLDATKASLKGMVNPDAVMAMLVSGMTMYMMLWVLPEPVSKGIAAVMTAVLVVYLGVDTLYTLGRGWSEAAGLAKAAPTLPGAAQASRLAVAEGSVGLEAVGTVESVTIGESGLTISLATGAVVQTSLMMSRHPGSGGTSTPGPRPSREERIAKLARDEERGVKKDDPTARREAEVAVDMEDQGRLKEPVQRPAKGDGHSGDVVDGNGQDWDIKRPHSRAQLEEIKRQEAIAAGRTPPKFDPGRRLRGEFDLKETLGQIHKEFASGENVIIDTSRLNAVDLAALRQALLDEGLLGTKVPMYP